ncbi:hypothetical protein QJQ45_016002 [Haematococcus lacustris]|nr:hypothetical protein QJQ45_016002 [Haematococcus lacustris]
MLTCSKTALRSVAARRASRQASRCTASAFNVQQALATGVALWMSFAPASIAEAPSTFYDELQGQLTTLDLPASPDDATFETQTSASLQDMLGAAERLSKSTGKLLSLSSQDPMAMVPQSQMVEVANRMKQDALALAERAERLARVERVSEADRKLALDIHEAAKLVSQISGDLARQEQQKLVFCLSTVNSHADMFLCSPPSSLPLVVSVARAMACYWGFQTTSNRVVWAIVFSLLAVGKILVIVGAIAGSTGNKCLARTRDCLRAYDNDTQYCMDIIDCDYVTYASLIIAGVVLWIVGALCTSYFCCCSKPHPGMASAATQPPLYNSAVSPYPVAHPAAPQYAPGGPPPQYGAQYPQVVQAS